MNSAIPREQLDELLPRVYDELRKYASRCMDNERDGHSFQTTELVHETYVRLAKITDINWNNKDHVLRAAIGVMRRVLIDYARNRNAKKRDATQLYLMAPNSGFDEAVEATTNIDMLALDEALSRLAELDGRKAEIVEMRYFGGQDINTVARLLDISPATVKRDWAMAKAWLYRELNEDTIVD